MWRLTERMVRSTLVTACRLATSPTSTSPDLAKATTDGVVRAPSAFAMTVGSPPSRTETTEFVVPRSMPTARAMLCYLRVGYVVWVARGPQRIVVCVSADSVKQVESNQLNFAHLLQRRARRFVPTTLNHSMARFKAVGAVVASMLVPPRGRLLRRGRNAPARSRARTTPADPSAAPSAPEPPHPSRPPRPAADPDDVRAATAVATVRHLAGDIGPRPGTSPAYFRAAAWVERRLRSLGWDVRRQSFPTPAGVSWGVPVPAGRSVNLVATRRDVRPGRPWLAVGAHLDTVPQAPGAEDNASGIGVLLAVAEATRKTRTRLPVVLLAFGSEEPRGPGDDDHHYGSRAYVAGLGQAQRGALRGMVSLDRVGVGPVVPVSSARGPDRMRAALLAAARRAGVPVPGAHRRPGQRPLVLRARGTAGRTARQHAVRRLPLTGRRARRRRPGPAASHRPDRGGLARAVSPHLAREGTGLLAQTSPRIAAAAAPATRRGANARASIS